MQRNSKILIQKYLSIRLFRNRANTVEFIRKLSVLLNASVSINHALDMIATNLDQFLNFL